LISCPFCSGAGDVWDDLQQMMIVCPVCRGMGLLEAPLPRKES
jgi:hypothetical protein